MKFKSFWIATVLIYLSACYNSNENLNFSDAKDIDAYYKIANSSPDVAKAYEDAFMQLKILHLNKTDIRTVSQDTCINKPLADKINQIKKTIELNIIDHNYLSYLVIDSLKLEEKDDSWNFMHSKNFNSLTKLSNIENNDSLSTLSLAHLLKILDNRFTVIIHQEAKLLPRTNKPNYVLGGFFEGYGLLYDLKNQQVMCYFNYRINNSSNYREDYMKDERTIYENMMLELISIHKDKMKNLIAEKLNLDPLQVELGF